MRIFVTGAAGFIGYHLCTRLLAEGHEVIGMDNLNDYYDPNLKLARLRELGIVDPEFASEVKFEGVDGFVFHYLDLVDGDGILKIFEKVKPEVVIHLAAQAGVRHSITRPQSFIDSNIQGLFNILEAMRQYPVMHFLYASSSSVYGSVADIPFKESSRTSQPVSLYGATKKAGEVITHSYVALYKIPATGLRFFTVYGPWGRPDMAYFKFADLIMKGEIIDIYNNGDMERDFTYVEDIISGIIPLIGMPPEDEEAPHRILNIGRSSPVNLLAFIEVLEQNLGKKAQRNYLPLQPGEIVSTFADASALKALTGYAPTTDLEEGIRRFAAWYMAYHGVATMV